MDTNQEGRSQQYLYAPNGEASNVRPVYTSSGDLATESYHIANAHQISTSSLRNLMFEGGNSGVSQIANVKVVQNSC